MAIQFNGSSQSYSTTSGIPTTVVTVICWLNTTATNTQFQQPWTIGTGTNNRAYVTTNPTGDGYFLSDSAGGTAGSGIATSFGTWYAIASVINGTSFTFYSGTSPATLTTQTSTLTAMTGVAALALGSNGPGTNNFFNGAIADFKMFNSALTLAQCTAELSQYDLATGVTPTHWMPFLAAGTTDLANTAWTGTGSPTTVTGPPIPWQTPAVPPPANMPNRAARVRAASF